MHRIAWWTAVVGSVVTGISPVIAQESKRCDLRGTVHGARAEPVRVTFWHNDMRRNAVEPLCAGPVATDGSFAFTDQALPHGFDWGFNTIVAVAHTKSRVGLLEIRGDGVALDRLVLQLEDTVDLHGSVASDGQPVAGASVWPAIFGEVIGNARPRAWVTAPLLPWRAVTDAEGKFTLRGLPPIQPLRLRVAHPDYALAWLVVDNLRQPCSSELARGGRISGVVRMPDGSPALRVRVVASGRGAGSGRTITDDDGRFTLQGLAQDVYKVWAEADGLTVVAAAGIEVEPGDHVRDQRVRLVAGGFIVGRIVDAATGKPVTPGPHTDVAMYGPARPDGGACECTPVLADGTFRIRAPEGTNRIYLRGSPGWSEPSTYVEVQEGKETEVEWRVQVR